VVTNYVTH